MSERSNNRNRWRAKIILMAVAGMILTGIFFFLVMQAPPVKLLRPNPNADRDAILELAESFYRQFPIDTPLKQPYKLLITAEINDGLFRYAQEHRKEKGVFPGLPVGYWSVIWQDTGSRKRKEDRKSGGIVFQVNLDFDGRLLSFKVNRKYLKTVSIGTHSEEDARMEAIHFLETLDVNTMSLILADKAISETSESTTSYKFTLKNKINPYPHVFETYKFEILGEQIIEFKKKYSPDPEALGWTRQYQVGLVIVVSTVILWLAILLVGIFLFIKKLRRDELEFKQAIRVGLFLALVLFLLIVLNSGENIWGNLLGGGLSASFIFLCVLVFYAPAESLIRDTWPDKIEVVDLLFRLKASVRETGSAILYAFFITGITLFLFGILVLGSSYFGIGYLTFDGHLLDAFRDFSSAFTIVNKNILISILTGILLFFFWPAFLKQKLVDRERLWKLFVAVSLLLGGLYFRLFNPTYIAVVLVIPIALFWTYVLRKWGLLTAMLAFWWSSFLLDLMLVLLIPQQVFSIHGMIAVAVPVLLLAWGIYLIYRPRSVKDFDAYVPDYVSRMAERERFLKELEIARGVQMRFLPQRVPQSPNLEIVSLCQPAMEVGGDYFDFIQMDDRYMTILIGDVSGKGVSAAFYMTMVKGIIKTLSKKTLQPSLLLTEANEIFYENAPREVFITIIYGVFDLQEKTLTIASAGHNPLLVWRHHSGETSMINPRGMALGLVQGDQYKKFIQERSISVEEKDVFVFYTDGVSEAMNEHEEIFGEERLMAVIKNYAHLSPQQLQERIVEAVAEFTGKAPQHDDFTMVVVKVRPAVQSLTMGT